jgi:hypothetical protein
VPAPAPAPKHTTSHAGTATTAHGNIVDPFGDGGSTTAQPKSPKAVTTSGGAKKPAGTIVDPFGGEAKPAAKKKPAGKKPAIVDPFGG